MLSLYRVSILFPVQKTLLPQDAAQRLIFPTCWSSSDGRIGEEVSRKDLQFLGCFIPTLIALIIHIIILRIQSYFCKVVPR